MDPETPKDPSTTTTQGDAPATPAPIPDNTAQSPGTDNPVTTVPSTPSTATTDVPAAPVVDNPGVVIGGPVMGGAGMPGSTGWGRKKWLLLAGAAVVVLGAAGYVFGYYLPNRPTNVYATALERTGMGYDRLVDYATDPNLTKKYTATAVSGDLKINSADYVTDGTFDLKADGKNADFKVDLGVLTSRVKAELIAKDVASSESPDVFLKVQGIKGYSETTGITGLSSLDNQWITVDHTFLDNITKSLSKETSSSVKLPDDATLKEAYKTIGDVADKYIFTGDKANGVVELRRYVGKETVDGKQTMHYKVGINKANYKKFIRELADKLDKTKLNTWVKDNYGKKISEYMNVDEEIKNADSIKSGDLADLWINTDTKLVHKLRISDPQDAQSYFELGLNYDGGDSYPFFMSFRDSTSGLFKVTASLNTKDDSISVSGSLSGNAEANGEFHMSVKPSNDKVSVTAPTGAISLNEALARLGLGGYLEALTQQLSGQAQALSGLGAQGGYTQEELQMLQSLYNVQ